MTTRALEDQEIKRLRREQKMSLDKMYEKIKENINNSEMVKAIVLNEIDYNIRKPLNLFRDLYSGLHKMTLKTHKELTKKLKGSGDVNFFITSLMIQKTEGEMTAYKNVIETCNNALNSIRFVEKGVKYERL